MHSYGCVFAFGLSFEFRITPLCFVSSHSSSVLSHARSRDNAHQRSNYDHKQRTNSLPMDNNGSSDGSAAQTSCCMTTADKNQTSNIDKKNTNVKTHRQFLFRIQCLQKMCSVYWLLVRCVHFKSSISQSAIAETVNANKK